MNKYAIIDRIDPYTCEVFKCLFSYKGITEHVDAGDLSYLYGCKFLNGLSDNVSNSEIKRKHNIIKKKRKFSIYNNEAGFIQTSVFYRKNQVWFYNSPYFFEAKNNREAMQYYELYILGD